MSLYSVNYSWLEAIYKCQRSFFLALIHGCFINQIINQLFGLSLFSIFHTASLIKMWRKFESKLIFVLIILYGLVFICFNFALISYYFDIKSNNYS